MPKYITTVQVFKIYRDDTGRLCRSPVPVLDHTYGFEHARFRSAAYSGADTITPMVYAKRAEDKCLHELSRLIDEGKAMVSITIQNNHPPEGE